MTGFITSLSELAALIFQSFRLPSLLPALAFTVANALIVFPSSKETVVGQLYSSTSESGQALILVLIAALTAYFLNTLNLTIIRWFEGYPLIEMPFQPGRPLLNLHKAHYLDLLDERLEIEIRLNEIRREERTQNPTTPEYKELRTKLQSINTELALFYPNDEDSITLTRLGNVIAAAENQPHILYNIDAVALWALLVPILTKEGYAKFIEQEKASLDFLLNTLVVVALIGLEIISIGIHNDVGWKLLTLEAIVVGLACWLLYNLSIQGALGWGQTIRTAFDLYRHKLRQELKIKTYRDYGQERLRWRQVSAFYRDGNIEVGNEIFDYAPKESKSVKENRPKSRCGLSNWLKSRIQKVL